MNNFTVIASAFRANLSMEHNLARHEDAMNLLVDSGMCDLKTAMGVYQDTGACCLKGANWAEHIGHWQEVTRQEAKEVGIYTLDTNGKYWMAA